MHNALCEQEGHDTDGNVDQEYPVPTVVVRYPSTKRWANGRRNKDRNAIHGKAHASLLGGEGVRKNRLFARLNSTACSLQYAEEESIGRLGASAQRNELIVKIATQLM